MPCGEKGFTYQGDNQAGPDIAEIWCTVGLALAKAIQEIGHLKKARNLTGVVPESE